MLNEISDVEFFIRIGNRSTDNNSRTHFLTFDRMFRSKIRPFRQISPAIGTRDSLCPRDTTIAGAELWGRVIGTVAEGNLTIITNNISPWSSHPCQIG